MDFPLYNNLTSNLPSKDLTVKQKEEFIQKTKTIDTDGAEHLVALIKHHFTQNNEESEDIPYNGEYSSTGEYTGDYTYNFLELPIPLRHILYKFIVMHYRKMEEEKEREKQRV